MAITSPRQAFQQSGPQTVPLEYADIGEWVRIIANFLQRLNPQVFQIIDHKGDFGILINATFDPTKDEDVDAFSRLNTSNIAWWVDIRYNNAIPGEDQFGSARGICFWRARSDAAQPLQGYANTDGWELRMVITENGNIVVQGGMEMDGNGFTPYGRTVHYTDSVTTPTAEWTGILKNLFLDFSGVDVSGDPSWFAGFDGINDLFVIRRWAAGVTGATNGGNLVEIVNDSSVRVGGPLRPGVYNTAFRPTASSYTGHIIYVPDAAAGSKLQYSDGSSWIAAG